MFQQISSILLIAFFVYFAIGQLAAAISARRNKRGYSGVPLFGGLAGALGFYLYPSGVYRPWWWVPLILDIYCVPMLIAIAVFWVRRLWRPGTPDSAKIQQRCDKQSSPPE